MKELDDINLYKVKRTNSDCSGFLHLNNRVYAAVNESGPDSDIGRSNLV